MMKRHIKRAVKAATPYGAVVLYRNYKHESLYNYCPICETESEFTKAFSAGVRVRPKAVCGRCGSLERHRLIWLFVTRKLGLQGIKKGKSMLHVAPEHSLRQRFSEIIGKKYLTADMFEDGVDIKMDITNIKYPNSSFDIIMVNHVLEHVDDDIKAIKELYRVQKKNGWAILLVPIANQAKTYEDSKIKSKKDRLEAFGQNDHARKYGADYIDRLRSVGYKVDVYGLNDIASRKEIRKMSLAEKGDIGEFTQSEIYFCTKS